MISAMIEVGIISFMINAPLSKEKGYRDVAKQGKRNGSLTFLYGARQICRLKKPQPIPVSEWQSFMR